MGLKTLVEINKVWFSLKERGRNLLRSTRFVSVRARPQTFDSCLHERRIYSKCVGLKMEPLTLVWRHCGNKDIWYLGVISMTQIYIKKLYQVSLFPQLWNIVQPCKKDFRGASQITLVISSLPPRGNFNPRIIVNRMKTHFLHFPWRVLTQRSKLWRITGYQQLWYWLCQSWHSHCGRNFWKMQLFLQISNRNIN